MRVRCEELPTLTGNSMQCDEAGRDPDRPADAPKQVWTRPLLIQSKVSDSKLTLSNVFSDGILFS